MTGRTEPVQLLEDLEPSDEVLWNARRIPCEVVAAGAVETHNGSIYVEYLVILEGPEGAEIWLERTGTGRIRAKNSAPYGSYENVNGSVKRVVSET